MLDSFELSQVGLVESLGEGIVSFLVESQLLLLWDGDLRSGLRIWSFSKLRLPFGCLFSFIILSLSSSIFFLAILSK